MLSNSKPFFMHQASFKEGEPKRKSDETYHIACYHRGFPATALQPLIRRLQSKSRTTPTLPISSSLFVRCYKYEFVTQFVSLISNVRVEFFV